MSVNILIATRIVTLLNEALACDASAVKILLETKVCCNDALLSHPTIQCNRDNSSVGLLGILNGIVGIHDEGEWTGFGGVAAVYNKESGELLEFVVLNGETIGEPPLEMRP